MISWLVSGLTFVVAVIILLIMAKVLCNKEKKPSELERETRTCKLLYGPESCISTDTRHLFLCVMKDDHEFIIVVKDVLLSTGVENTYVALSINKL